LLLCWQLRRKDRDEDDVVDTKHNLKHQESDERTPG